MTYDTRKLASPPERKGRCADCGETFAYCECDGGTETDDGQLAIEEDAWREEA